MKYEDSHNCLVYAVDCNDIFFAAQRDDKYYVFEYLPLERPSIKFTTYESKGEFLSMITWYPWIIEGIQNEGFKDEVIKFNLFDKEIIDGK